MTNSPNLGKPRPESDAHRRLWLLLLTRTSLAFGVILLVGVIGGAWWSWNFVHQRLAPMVEKSLSQMLKRPVRLGQVESFWLDGIRFGASSIPAIATDPDQASIQAVRVEFKPLSLLLNRTLQLDITLIQPNIYIEQAQDGRWISTAISTEAKPGPIKTELDFIRFQNANVVLVPNTKVANRKAPIAFAQVNGLTNLLDNNQRIRFEVAGQQPAVGGNINLKGEFFRPTQKTNLLIRGQNLLATDVDRIIKLPAIDFQAGRVDGNLMVQLQKQQSPSFLGTTNFRGATVQVRRVADKFTKTNGQLQFKGQRIQFQNVSTLYGTIPGQINGYVNTRTGYNLTAQVKAVNLKNIIETLELKLPFAAAAEVQANLKLTGPLAQPILSGTAQAIKLAQIDKVNLRTASVRFKLAASNLAFTDIKAQPVVGGQVTGSGDIKLGRRGGLVLDFLAQNVPGDAIARIYGATPNITIGTVSAAAEIFGPTGSLQTVVQWQAPEATYPGTGKIRVAGGTTEFQDTELQVAGGTLNARGQLAKGRWQAFVDGSQLQLGRLVSALPQNSPLQQGLLNGQLALAGTTASFKPAAIQGTGQGQLSVAGGTINFKEINLNAGRWQALVAASEIQLNRFSPKLQGPLKAELQLAGSLTDFKPGTIQGTGQAELNVAGGTINVRDINLNAGRWQALVAASQVQLNRFSPNLRGQFGGQLDLAGSLESFQASTIAGSGQVRLSEGVSLIDRPLTAAVQWDGEKLRIQEATASGFRASGLIFAQLQGAGAPRITSLNLDVAAQDLDLQALPFKLPSAIKLAGQADFAGRLTGTLPVPNVAGTLDLNRVVVNNLPFESPLTGQISLVAGQGLDLRVVGQQDQIALVLDRRNRPVSFNIQRGEAIAQGQTQGENLLVSVRNFPLGDLNLTPTRALGLGPVRGQVTAGNFTVNLARSTVVGDVQIAQPAIGAVTGDTLTASFRYDNGVARLLNGELRQGESQYLLAGSLVPGANPQFKGQINIAQGKLQEVLKAAQLFDLQDLRRGLKSPTYAKAADVQPLAVGLPEAPLQTQLRRLSEVEALVQQQLAQRRASPLPALSELEGTFSGQITVDGSSRSGITADFNLQGQDWKWGNDLSAKQVIAIGNFEQGVVTLLPLRFQSEDSLLAFSGQVGGQQQSGQLRVENLSVEALQNFVELPIDVTGKLNATATLGGSLANPQARGELALVDGTLNQTPIETGRGSFSYADARLNFGSTVVISGPEPIQIIGNVPVALPFATVKPDNDQISLKLDVQNEGLALLNLFTEQVAWVDGKGQVKLQVEGTLKQPIATGIATVQDATLRAQALPEPLTNVTGTIRFNRDRIQVEGIQGQFSRGQVVAAGTIPIFNAARGPVAPEAENPLTASLDNIALNLKGLYRGGVNGRVVITGSALSPTIGGEIRLTDGQVQLPDTSARATNAGSPGTVQPGAKVAQRPARSSNTTGAAPEFNDLKLVLGDRVVITRQPILSFLASGDLTLNGILGDLRPRGTIRLRRGQVNLFVTRFTLARGYEQTATFTPSQGLDPELDIRLIASVAEVTRSRLPSSPLSSEINDAPSLATNLGALQTVRIQARATGPASQLVDNLELTSSPARSRTEIVALIGGGFIDTLGRGDSTLAIANLAGSALLTNIQDAIGNAIGASEFRLFPTTVIAEKSRTSTLGLGAEVGIDISRNFSASVLKVLTAEQPAQYNLRYRVNDKVLLRGSTDFSGDSRAVAEFEARF